MIDDVVKSCAFRGLMSEGLNEVVRSIHVNFDLLGSFVGCVEIVVCCFMSSMEVVRSGGRIGDRVGTLVALKRHSTLVWRFVRSLVWFSVSCGDSSSGRRVMISLMRMALVFPPAVVG